MVRLATFVTAVIGLVHALPVLQAREPFRFPEAKYGKGELRYINGLPVVRLAGTPEEIGEQMRVLTRSASPYLLTYPAKFLKSKGHTLGDPQACWTIFLPTRGGNMRRPSRERFWAGTCF